MGTLTCLHCYRRAGMIEGHLLGCQRTRRAPTDAELARAITAALKAGASK